MSLLSAQNFLPETPKYGDEEAEKGVSCLLLPLPSVIRAGALKASQGTGALGGRALSPAADSLCPLHPKAWPAAPLPLRKSQTCLSSDLPATPSALSLTFEPTVGVVNCFWKGPESKFYVFGGWGGIFVTTIQHCPCSHRQFANKWA